MGKIDYIVGHWWLNSVSSPPPQNVSPLLLQTSNHMLSSAGTQPPSLGSSRSHLINITKDIFVALSISDIPRVLRALCQKREDQIYISYYKSQYHIIRDC